MIVRFLKLSLIVLFLWTNNASAQEKLSTKDKISIKEANGAFISGDYISAIRIYKTVQAKDLNNSFLNYRIGFCHLEMNEIEEAIEYFKVVDPKGLEGKNMDFLFAYGKALQYQGKYNTALTNYDLFLKTGKPKDVKYYEVERFIKQCNFAIENIKKPVSVQIGNLGDFVNSDYDDYHPNVSIDGKVMVFSSRRSGGDNTNLLGDNQYYENVYSSLWNSENQSWNESKLINGAINSTGDYISNTGLSPDGKSILIYKNSKSINSKVLSGIGSGDIYLSTIGTTGIWSAPVLIPGINSDFFDGGATFSPDGKKIYFISDRAGLVHGKNIGGKDIWFSELQEDQKWGKPQNLGPIVNTPHEEISVFMHPNGKTLFFVSAGHDEINFGGYDIFKSDLINGAWAAPINIGFPINSPKDEKEFYVSTDGRTGWMSAKKDSKNKVDIYQIDLTFYNVLTGESEPLAIVKGMVLDNATGLPLKTKVSFKNQKNDAITEVFSSDKGEYFTTLIANSTYNITVAKNDYLLFEKELTITLPEKSPEPKKKRKTNKNKNEVEEVLTTAEAYTLSYDINLSRTNALNVISQDLFKTQAIRFSEVNGVFEIQEFSKTILDLYASQLSAEQKVFLTVNGHFDAVGSTEELSLNKSSVLANLVLDYLVNKGADKSRINVFPLGDTQPTSTTNKEINQRVEINIKL